ncbi:MAG TPA: hypothetical protein VKG92_02625 [Flavobacteriales bacterium]|nr:hypothetical protein [Flavobacteriales bacterium]
MFIHRTLAALVFTLLMTHAFATHLLGGEIRYSHVNGYTYSIEVMTWCDLASPADRPEIEVDFGDGMLDTVPRTTILDDPIGNSCGGLATMNTRPLTRSQDPEPIS